MKDSGSTAKTEEVKSCRDGCVYVCMWVLYGWGVGSVCVCGFVGGRCWEHLRVKVLKVRFETLQCRIALSNVKYVVELNV